MPSYLVLARKYRPATFSEVVGQSHVIQALTNAVTTGRVAHAFLFCGVRGVGKTTVARILAKSLNCTNRAEGEADPCNRCSSCREIGEGISVDVQEIDGASNTSVENIREINENIKYPPVGSPFKIIIIDEVHMISISAFNALLKTLEEPPAHAKFIFATTEPHKVPATIHSRCQQFNFRTIPVVEMIAGMQSIVQQEGVQASDDALALVAREAQGSFRDALSLLDQVIAFTGGSIEVQDVESALGIIGRQAFARIVQAILDHDAAEGLKLLHELYNGGYDPEQLVLDLIDYLRGLIVVHTVPRAARPEGMVDAAPGELDQMEQLVEGVRPEQLQYLFEMLIRSESEVKRASNPWVILEMTIIRMATAPDIVDLSEIVRRLDSADLSPVRGPTRGKATVGRTSPPGPTPAPPVENGPSKPKGPSQRQRPASKDPPHAGGDASEEDTAPPAQPQSEAHSDEGQGNGFVITRITPVSESPDKLWSAIRKELTDTGVDPMVAAMMDHGRILSLGPNRVEIGFHKSFYKDQFQARLESKPELRKVFEEFLGGAAIKVLTLAEPTSLDTEKPYPAQADGETDRTRALKQEALEHPIVVAVQQEFEDCSIDDIKILKGGRDRGS